MRLLIVATDYPPKVGGVATYGFQLAQALSKTHEVTVLAAGQRDRRDQAPGPTTIRVSGPMLFQYLLLAWQLWRLLRGRRFDAVLHTTWPSAVISDLLRLIAFCPYFVSVHASEILDDRRSWRRRVKLAFRPLKMRMLHHASGLFPVSHYTAGLLEAMGLGDVPICVINNGVDTQRFVPKRKPGFASPPRLLTVARLDAHKGHDVVLRALARLIASGVQVRYRVVGSGEEEARLKRLADELGIRACVEFMGFVSDAELPGVYADSDIYIMLSREIPGRVDLIEGFGISFLEASAAGLPVIAGRSGGVPDAVIDGETGVLVAPEDVASVEGVLGRMLSDEEMAMGMGRKGRVWTEQQMRWDMVAGRIATAMRSMVA